MIKTVIFDLGGVIVPFDFRRGYEKMRPYCKYSVEEIPQRIARTNLVVQLESGLIEPERFFEQLSKVLDLEGLSYEEFRRIWFSVFFVQTLIPESLFEQLRRNYRLLLLSNTNVLHFEMIREQYPLLRHFHDYILSYKVGVMKPDPRIYAEAIARSGSTPEECFYTDDVPAYVEGARKAGIDAVQFQSCDQVRRELQARGVDC